MTDKEILEKAIRKAIDNGWNSIPFGEFRKVDGDSITGELYAFWEYKDLWSAYSLYGIIYNHDFAKALWGEEPADEEIPGWYEYDEQPKLYKSYDDPALFIGPNWMYQLQQMVISDDPIKYLGEYLLGGER